MGDEIYTNRYRNDGAHEVLQRAMKQLRVLVGVEYKERSILQKGAICHFSAGR